VPAAAVKRKGLALFGLTGCKGCVGWKSTISLKLKFYALNNY